MDHVREFDNEVQFREFCNANGITHNFSAPRTLQSNGVVERKNRTLQEMSRTMLNEQSLPPKFWFNVIDTSIYILNQILIRAILGKTPYELMRGRKPTLEYFKVFRSKCFILNTKYYMTKFDPKSYEGIFLGYSQNSKAYIILNKHTMKIEESLNVTFDETPIPSNTSPLMDDDLDEEEEIKATKKKNLEIDIKDETLEIDEVVNVKKSRNHPLENVIENLNQEPLVGKMSKYSTSCSLALGSSFRELSSCGTISINITPPSSSLVQTSLVLDDRGTNLSDSKNELNLRTFSAMNVTDGSGGVGGLTWIFLGRPLLPYFLFLHYHKRRFVGRTSGYQCGVCGPSRWKELSKESGSKILLCGDGSWWKTFKPIASSIAKGKLK
nr:retrovirus-related Pol polyprotein from transposon TNT 1-94 [Tanacetum cinerariifolium]